MHQSSSHKVANEEMAPEVTASTLQRMLTTKEVCEYVGIASHTFLEWRSTMRHTTPVAYRMGSQLRFRPEDVEAWIETLKEEGGLR
jgi:excisionase family DNA binding protein